MYVSMKDMLDHACAHNYAIMACNCCNMETALAIVHAATEEKSPVIINISARQFNAHADLKAMVPMIKNLAQKAPVPIALNLDHGMEHKDVLACVQAGFSSIMFDGSALPYEKNLEITKMVVAMSHGVGASVEAELGHVGQAAAGDGENTDFFTDVDTAVEFVEQTGVDALAVAVGTAHGKYPKGFVPKLDFERLSELKAALKMPLVLHGGSGSGEENIRRAVACGINKINVCTDVFAVGRDRIAEALAENPSIDLMDLMDEAQKAMEEYIRGYMQMIGSSGRYFYSRTASAPCD